MDELVGPARHLRERNVHGREHHTQRLGIEHHRDMRRTGEVREQIRVAAPLEPRQPERLLVDRRGRDRGTGDEPQGAHGILDEAREARRALARVQLERDRERAAPVGLATEARRDEQARLGPAGGDVAHVGADD